jgi:hypothetical protein
MTVLGKHHRRRGFGIRATSPDGPTWMTGTRPVMTVCVVDPARIAKKAASDGSLRPGLRDTRFPRA